MPYDTIQYYNPREQPMNFSFYDKPKKRVADITKVSVYNHLRIHRLIQGLSQEDLAHKCKVSANMIYKIETRLVAPKITTVFLLSDVLGVDVEKLFFRKGEGPKLSIAEQEIAIEG